MPTHKVLTNNPNLSDPETARQLGRRLWTESDLQLDFTGVESVTPAFATELCRTILEKRAPAVLHSALMLDTMTSQVQATFLPAIMAALGRSTPQPQPAPPPAASPDQPTPSRPATTLNPFDVLDNVQADYLTYVRTFQRFQNPRIRDWVMDRIQHGTLLWKPPYIQLSRPFAHGEALASLVDAGLLHPGILPVFRRNPDDPDSPPIHPYKHQTDAIQAILAQNPPSPELGGGGQGVGANVVVATGTGSGKSFAFGIPIVSAALRMREQNVRGIKAVIVYPMNALAKDRKSVV